MKDIWFIDDNDIFRTIIQGFLKNTEYSNRVEYYTDGDEGMMEAIRRNKSQLKMPKLIFLDLNMNNLDGWQMIDLLNVYEGIPTKVVIISSSNSVADQSRAKESRMVVDFLTKPVSKTQIETTLNQYA